jgi:hypothetical protein
MINSETENATKSASSRYMIGAGRSLKSPWANPERLLAFADSSNRKLSHKNTPVLKTPKLSAVTPRFFTKA